MIAGTWRPNNESFDFYLVKTDSLGNLQWDKPIGVGPDAWVRSGGLTRDGGCILVGEKQNDSGACALLVKTDAQGDTQWSRSFEADTNPYSMVGSAAQQTLDGGYIVCAHNWREGSYLIKTGPTGNVVWQRVFLDERISRYNQTDPPVQQTTDGGFIVGTLKDSVPCLIKTDSLGIEQWKRHYPGLGVRRAESVRQTLDDGYVATGVAASPSRDSDLGDVYLLKTDASGSLLWKRTFGGPLHDDGHYVTETADGGYLIAGTTDGDRSGDHKDGYVARTDSLGNVAWTKKVGEPDAADYALCVQQTADGGYIITGWMGFREDDQGCMYLMKLAPEQSK